MTRLITALILSTAFISCNPCNKLTRQYDKSSTRTDLILKEMKLKGCAIQLQDTSKTVIYERDTIILHDTLIDSFYEVVIRDTIKIKEGVTSTKTKKGVTLTTTISDNNVITEATCDSLVKELIIKQIMINTLRQETNNLKSSIFVKEKDKKSFYETVKLIGIIVIIILSMLLILTFIKKTK